jgi:hypothetical protein
MKESGIESATFRFVAQCLNHYATAFPPINVVVKLFNYISKVLAEIDVEKSTIQNDVLMVSFRRCSRE